MTLSVRKKNHFVFLADSKWENCIYNELAFNGHEIYVQICIFAGFATT